MGLFFYPASAFSLLLHAEVILYRSWAPLLIPPVRQTSSHPSFGISVLRGRWTKMVRHERILFSWVFSSLTSCNLSYNIYASHVSLWCRLSPLSATLSSHRHTHSHSSFPKNAIFVSEVLAFHTASTCLPTRKPIMTSITATRRPPHQSWRIGKSQSAMPLQRGIRTHSLCQGTQKVAPLKSLLQDRLSLIANTSCTP